MDKIYIPVEKINSIYKYSDKDSVKPKLNKLNSSNWEKTKTYIKRKAQDISKELGLEYFDTNVFSLPDNQMRVQKPVEEWLRGFFDARFPTVSDEIRKKE